MKAARWPALHREFVADPHNPKWYDDDDDDHAAQYSEGITTMKPRTGPPYPDCGNPTRRTKRLLPDEMVLVCPDCKRYSAAGLSIWLTDAGDPRLPVLEHLRRLIERRKEDDARHKVHVGIGRERSAVGINHYLLTRRKRRPDGNRIRNQAPAAPLV